MRIATNSRQLILATGFGLSGLVACASGAAADGFVQMDLVSDVPGLAQVTDPSLMNPWGVSESGTGPFWVSDQSTNVSTLYSVTPAGVSKLGLTVTIPTTAAGPQGPTGQVQNPTSAFLVGSQPANFVFANLNGTISAWNSGTTAQIKVTTPGAVYTGLAIDKNTQQIYAANSASGGSIDVFNGSFQKVGLPAGAFVDPSLPANLVPFNVQELNGKIYVTYAPAGHGAQTTAAAGSGAIAVFATNGTFIGQLVSGGNLASPWGITLAPSGFGQFGGDLLVGNFSFDDSAINAFDPTTGAFEGSIPIDAGAGDSAGGLWDLSFGNGGSGGDANTLYFTDGINGEANGLFAAISAIPEPSTLVLLAPVIGLIAARVRLRRG